VGSGLVLGADGFYRTSRNLIDEGQFGAPIILTPFNYRDGKIYGLELSATYARGPLSAYANFTYQKAQGRDIVSSQFNFDLADLAYIASHYIYLDHDQTYTASAGASYRFDEGTTIGADAIYGSGLRRDGEVPNGAALPNYIQVNLTVSHKFTLPHAGELEARLDVTNVFDKVYEIRDGSGVGVGAPQYGPRRGYFVGLSKSF
jgi:outer membrane receptor protein involved in Fe transport